MFKRKDVIRTLFLIMVILVIMVTLSQILVVHRKNHRNKKSRDTDKTRGMLKMLLNIEKSIEAMMKKEYLSTANHEEQLLAEVYAERIKQQLLRLKSPKTVKKDASSNANRLRKFGVGTYSAFQERKLRFLQHKEMELLTRTKAEHLTSSLAKYFIATKVNDRNNSNNISLSINGAKYDINANVISKGNPENQSTEFSTEFTLEKSAYYLTNAVMKADTHNSNGNNMEHPRRITIKTRPKGRCPNIPKDLEGMTNISPIIPNHHIDEIQFMDIRQGGNWKPENCIARQRTAIIIPYRNRETHLHTLLHYLIPVLKRQLIEFRIFVPEQYGSMTFNKGRVMNAGFMEAWKIWSFDCVIFHDVDLLPENDRNMYTCGMFPRHMSISVDKFSYRLPYWTLVGGVFSIRREQFLRVNGYSNLYWGWGAEDDDMAYRLKASNLKIERPPANVGRYKMIKHANRETSPVKMRAYLLKTVRKRFHRDGLNTLDYRIVFTNNTKLYTHIMVDIGQPPEEAANISKLLN